MNSPWRYRVEGDLAWTYATTLTDIKADTKGQPVEVQKRTGTKRSGYEYESYTIKGA